MMQVRYLSLLRHSYHHHHHHHNNNYYLYRSLSISSSCCCFSSSRNEIKKTKSTTKANDHNNNEDATLIWARNNPIIAQSYLNIPSSSLYNYDNELFISLSTSLLQTTKIKKQQQQKQSIIFPFESFEDYWNWRRWYFISSSSPIQSEGDVIIEKENNSNAVDDNYDRSKIQQEQQQQQQQEQQYGQALSSHVLSAPLTISSILLPFIMSSLHFNKKQNKNSYNNDSNNENDIHYYWCCLGARAESLLPIKYWKEILIIAQSMFYNNNNNQMNHYNVHFHLHFIGPEIGNIYNQTKSPIIIQFPSNTINNNIKENVECNDSMTGSSTLTIQWIYNGMYHDYYHQQQNNLSNNNNSKNSMNDYDAYILLNPGIGHSFLMKDWKPTLDIILQKEEKSLSFNTGNKKKKRMILLTAHSNVDANRDALYLNQQYHEYIPTPIIYNINPYASRIKYQDPLIKDYQHYVSPNAYITKIEI